MNKLLLILLTSLSVNLSGNTAEFRPPNGWNITPEDSLPEGITFMCTFQNGSYYPPSINLGSEPYKGTPSDYNTMMKRVNALSGDSWKNMGKFSFTNGVGALSQVDMKTKWGDVRLLHLVHVRDRQVFVVTAAAKKEDFSKILPSFLIAFKTLKIEPLVCANDRDHFLQLVAAHEKLVLKTNLSDEEIFYSQEFQDNLWIPFSRQVSKATLDYTKKILTYNYD